MRRFLSLPREVLTLMAEALPRNFLPVLALTCRELHGLVNPLIYRFVYFWERKEHWWYYLDHVLDTISLLQEDNHFTRLVRIYQPTQIFDLAKFISTIETSPTLRSYVVAAGFECNKGEAYRDRVNSALDLLRPTTEFIHVWPATTSQGESVLGPAWTIGATSMQVHYDDLGANRSTGMVDRETMYATCSIPTLRRLYIMGGLSWRQFPMETEPISREKTSNIISLCFATTNALGKDLEEILTWPKALKSFRHSMAPVNHERHVVSPERYSTALYPQRHSLEVLRIGTFSTGWESDGSTLSSFHAFTKLKRLLISSSFVFKAEDEEAGEAEDENGLEEEEEEEEEEEDGSEGEEHSAEDTAAEEDQEGEDKEPDLYTLLPRSLEELEITFEPDFEWYETLPNTSEQSLTKRAQKWIRCLKDIAEHKNALFPSLRGIPLCKWTLDYQEIIYGAASFGEDPAALAMLEAFRDAGVAFRNIDLRGLDMVGGRLH